MSHAPHTPGKLAYTESEYEPNRFTVGIIGERWLLAVQHNGEQDIRTQRENVRRLVACWNACDGIPTETLKQTQTITTIELFRKIDGHDRMLAAAKAWLADETDDGSFADTLRQIIARSPE